MAIVINAAFTFAVRSKFHFINWENVALKCFVGERCGGIVRTQSWYFVLTSMNKNKCKWHSRCAPANDVYNFLKINKRKNTKNSTEKAYNLWPIKVIVNFSVTFSGSPGCTLLLLIISIIYTVYIRLDFLPYFIFEFSLLWMLVPSFHSGNGYFDSPFISVRIWVGARGYWTHPRTSCNHKYLMISHDRLIAAAAAAWFDWFGWIHKIARARFYLCYWAFCLRSTYFVQIGEFHT